MNQSFARWNVREIEPEWKIDPEEMGTRQKFWYSHPGDPRPAWLFKHPRQNTGEHWAEKIAAEVADLLSTPHTRVELAVLGDQRGTVTRSFVDEGDVLFHGNQFLEIIVDAYDTKTRFGQSRHTLGNIWVVLDWLFGEGEESERAKCRIAQYLVLDALIGNTDRHHENWGVLVKRTNHGWEGKVAPSFDHASSLGRELRDARRARLLAENRVGYYSEKGRGGVYWSEVDRRGPGPLELTRRAGIRYESVFRPALAVVRDLDFSGVSNVVDRIPECWMSVGARDFAKALLRYNYKELRRLVS